MHVDQSPGDAGWKAGDVLANGLSEVAGLLRTAGRVVFFTGAGMSAESGVPTYRGAGGIWQEYDYQAYACQAAFDADPARVWDFHDLRRQTTGACAPHDGHQVLSRLEKLHPSSLVVTQNIDGLHQRAGCRDVVELHGSMWRIRCDACRERQDNREMPLAVRRHRCGRYWRPDIVWFGDTLQMETVQAAVKAASEADLFVSIGTSAVVFPAAELPRYAKAAGALLVEVNPEETPLSPLYDVCVRAKASETLVALYDGFEVA